MIRNILFIIHYLSWLAWVPLMPIIDGTTFATTLVFGVSTLVFFGTIQVIDAIKEARGFHIYKRGFITRGYFS